MADGVRLSELVAAMGRRATPVASETGLFVALQAAEALGDAPAAITADEVRITPEGAVDTGRPPPCDGPTAVRAVAALVEASVSPLPASARVLVERAREGKIPTLAALRAELEALLVPLNRAAARRVLGRLVREHERAGGAGAPAASEAHAQDPGALDTHPDADAAPSASDNARARTSDGALATTPDGVPLLDPKIPPPPRLGSLSKLVPPSSALDTQPDGAVAGGFASDRPAASATDTVLDGDDVEPDPRAASDRAVATHPGAATDSSDLGEPSSRPPPPRPRGALYLVALLVAAAAAFLLYRVATH